MTPLLSLRTVMTLYSWIQQDSQASNYVPMTTYVDLQCNAVCSPLLLAPPFSSLS